MSDCQSSRANIVEVQVRKFINNFSTKVGPPLAGSNIVQKTPDGIMTVKQPNTGSNSFKQ